jgi:phage N-6-adenine-methyltransferase
MTVGSTKDSAVVAEPLDLFEAREQPPTWWSTDHWATSPEFMALLEAEYGPFDLDPCCREETAKAPRFYTPKENGLLQPWEGRIFCNPPFSRPAPWIKRAIEAAKSGHLVVMLLPVKTDTKWFHDLVLPYAQLRFIRGRLTFYGWKGTPLTAARFPNMIAVFCAPYVTGLGEALNAPPIRRAK